ncbi:MAG TPA: GDSL-type esterase/lipase family protein [Thermoanaerobaculia bacterium]|nr:GDSL-type esterase/lipase family protein [Thermoanaerobaculia bacterium]
MNKRLLGFLVLVLSLGFFFLVGEAALRLLSRHWLSVYDVEMWSYARTIKKVSQLPGVVEEQRSNAAAQLMGATVRTDEHGFRRADPATEAHRRPGNRGRRLAIAVGDSLTFGWGVPEGQTFPDQLEHLLAEACPRAGARPVTVLNAGIGNCNTSMEFARYRLTIRQLRPEWVILGFSFNDAEADPVPSENPFLWHSALLALASSRLLKHSDPKLQDFNAYYLGLYQDGLPGWENAKRALREFGALLKADGVPGTLFLMPELHQPKNFGPLAGVYAKVTEIGRQSGWEVIDGSVDFPPGAGDRYFVSAEDAHPNASAQAIYARALARSKYACAR